MLCAHVMDCTIGKKPKLWEPKSFVMGNKHELPLLQWQTLSFLYWIITRLALCSKVRHYLYLSRLFTNVLEDSKAKAVSKAEAVGASQDVQKCKSTLNCL